MGSNPFPQSLMVHRLLQLMQDLIGACHDARRHSCQPGHMDTKAVSTSTWLQFAQEDDLPVHLAHTHIEILDTREASLHLVQLMIMGGKECTRMTIPILMDILHDGPCYADAVIGTGTSSQFIKEDERTLGEVVHDIGSLAHLHHEGTLTHRDIVTGSHSCEDLVHISYMCRLGRHEASHLCHQGDECSLAQQGTLTGHVGSGDDDNLLLLGVEVNIVGHILFAQGQLFLYDGMPSLANVDDLGVVHQRAHIAVLLCTDGKGEQTVQLSQQAGIGLDGGCIFCQSIDQVGKEACLQVEYTFLCSRDFLFVFLEFLGDVSLSLSECLFSDPLLRNLILIRIAYLQVISKYIVVSYLQALNARSLGLSLLNVQEILLAVEGHLPEFIQFRVHSFTYHVSTVDLQRSVGIHLSLYTVADVGTELHSGTYLAEGLIVGLHAFLLDGHHGLQGIAELNDISGVHTSRTHSSDDSLQVAYVVQMLLHQIA